MRISLRAGRDADGLGIGGLYEAAPMGFWKPDIQVAFTTLPSLGKLRGSGG